jgi:metallo-beta-lactamase class B
MRSDAPFPIRLRLRTFLALSALGLSALTTAAQPTALFRSWNQPVPPFNIVGNVYYVGASDIASYLIATPKGLVVLEGGFAETAPLIERNVRALGFKVEDIKILLTSHAHLDHAGGLGELKRLSGARLVASAPEAEGLARGGQGDFHWGNQLPFPPVIADQIVGDGETISLGGVGLTAHLTPGHTQGCTTWTMQTTDHDRTYDIVFMASLTAPGYDLVHNPRYPNIGADLLHSCERLRALPCDIWLAPHGAAFGLTAKRSRLGAGPNPFVDPTGYRLAIDQAERAIRKRLASAADGSAQPQRP